MESIPTDQKDRPQSDITIEDTIVFVNPYTEVDAQVRSISSASWIWKWIFFQLKLERERKEKRAADDERINATVPSAKSSTAKKPVEAPTTQVFRSGVGKYIPNQV